MDLCSEVVFSLARGCEAEPNVRMIISLLLAFMRSSTSSTWSAGCNKSVSYGSADVCRKEQSAVMEPCPGRSSLPWM